MTGKVLCKIGLRTWHDEIDDDDGTQVIVCNRRQRMQVKPFQTMALIGWVGHQNS